LIWHGFLFRMGGDLPDTSWSPTGTADYVTLLASLGDRHE